ncbi:MAG: F0F1 ATP synthase subunit gamma [Lentisphaeria bacterium]|nr:F0F1 ATP synthase subunit gamma [Lentisphaeria bacterium]
MTLEELRTELQINGELTEIVDALKAVAISEFKNLEEARSKRFSMFLSAFEGFFQMLDFSTIKHPFAQDTTGVTAIVMLTSDERFMGGLNKRIVDEALIHPSAADATLAVVGQQGSDYLKSLGRDFTRFPEDVSTTNPFDSAIAVRDWMMKAAVDDQVGSVIVAYPKPVSFIIQKVDLLTLLPCTELLFFERKEHRRHDEILQKKEEVLVDSKLESLIEYLVSTWVAEKLLEVFEDSRQAELSAKAMRLEESFQSLNDTRKGLVHSYHRTHHEALDKGMRDTFSATVMRKKAG